MTPNDRELLELAWVQLWQVTALVVVVGAVARFGCRRRPHLAYALWMLVMLKCLTPPLWSSCTGVFSWAQVRIEQPTTQIPISEASVTLEPPSPPRLLSARRAPVETARRPEIVRPAAVRSEVVRPEAATWTPDVPSELLSVTGLRRELPVSPARIVLAVWLAGATVLAVVVLRRWLRLSRAIRSTGVSADPAIEASASELARRLGLRRRIVVRVTSEPFGPAVFGLGRTVVVLPQAVLENKSPRGIEPILAHELIHVRRGDPLWGALQVLVEVVWWFHPLVWWANREACRERERCCDHEVIAGLKCRPDVYARCLLDVLESERAWRPMAAVPGVRSAEVTTRRLEDIMNRTSQFRHRTPAWCWAILASLAALILPGKGLVLGMDPQASTSPPLESQDTAPLPVARQSQTLADNRANAQGRPAADEVGASLLGRLWNVALGGSGSAAGLYDVPAGAVQDLRAFLDRVDRYQPRTLRGDFEHRRRAPAAIQQAAKRILELEKDHNSPAYRAAEAAILRGRIRGLPGALQTEQRATLAQVQEYVAKRIAAGQTPAALGLAELACQTLQNAGHYRRAADASRILGELFLKLDKDGGGMPGQYLRANAEWLAAKAKEFQLDDRPRAIPPRERLVLLDVQPVANRSCDDLAGPGVFEGNGLAELPRGEQTLGGIPFTVGERLVILGGKKTPELPKNLEGIQVNRRILRLYALHSSQFSNPPHLLYDGDLIGQYTLNYEDGSSVALPIVFGHHVRDWWNDDRGRPVKKGEVVWTGSNRVSEYMKNSLRLYLGVWENPHPEKRVTTLGFKSTDTDAGPFCVALTVEEKSGR